MSVRALAAALPWLVVPLVGALRARRSRSLDEESDAPPPDAPLVSVIIPARNEAHNIERCVRSVLASSYSALEVLVVNDHSDDGTGEIARAIVREDPRLRVVDAPPLPTGWFGKQWACDLGAAAARGDFLLFGDADTMQAPDLIPRAINAMRSHGLDMLSVAGWQELGSFWERVIQPQIFALIGLRYGGTESVNRSPRAVDKIANGQCLLVRRDAYTDVGGHASVRGKVAEDVALAQHFFARGKKTAIVLGLRQLTTRMYRSLGESIGGWTKNIFAGTRDATPGGRVGRGLLPVLLILPPLMALAPTLALLAAPLGVLPRDVTVWAAISTGAWLGWWLIASAAMRLPLAYALLFPLGAAILLYIVLRALVRGRRVQWKGREYVAE